MLGFKIHHSIIPSLQYSSRLSPLFVTSLLQR